MLVLFMVSSTIWYILVDKDAFYGTDKTLTNYLDWLNGMFAAFDIGRVGLVTKTRHLFISTDADI